MTLSIKMQLDGDLLRVETIGRFSLREAKRTFVEMMNEVIRHKCNRILIDGRLIKGEPEMIERFYYGEFAAQTVMEHTKRQISYAPRFAYVLSVPVLDPNRFGEIVAQNRSMKVKAFDNDEDAICWLGMAHPPRRIRVQDS